MTNTEAIARLTSYADVYYQTGCTDKLSARLADAAELLTNDPTGPGAAAALRLAENI